MTEEQRLAAAVQTIIDANMDAAEISPSWVATEAMAAIKFPRELHRLGYAGCHLELRQIARSKLRRQFDPINQAWEASAETDEEDYFQRLCRTAIRGDRKRGRSHFMCCAC